MCLDYVNQKMDLPKSGIGYKVFKQDNKRLYGPYQQQYRFLTNKTHRDVKTGTRISHGDRRTYQTGYHIFDNLDDAKSFCSMKTHEYSKCVVYKVQWWKATARGTQDLIGGSHQSNVTVARTMKLLERIK